MAFSLSHTIHKHNPENIRCGKAWCASGPVRTAPDAHAPVPLNAGRAPWRVCRAMFGKQPAYARLATGYGPPFFWGGRGRMPRARRIRSHDNARIRSHGMSASAKAGGAVKHLPDIIPRVM